MRQQKSSEEYSRHRINKESRQNGQNQLDSNQIDDDQVNCPLIFKTCLVALVTCGILAFVISFGTEMSNTVDLGIGDFLNCGDHSNVRRLVKSYAYEKIILGLLISAVIISFGLTVFMIYLSYNYCQCFGDCYQDKSESSSVSENIDIHQYQIQLKKRIASNILMPKSQPHQEHNQSGNKQKRKQLQRQQRFQKREQFKSQSRKRFRKTRSEIIKFDENYSKYIKNSETDQFDCQCEDCGSCVAYCVGCLWCRSCFEAHHYHFYNSKNQEYYYWIAYMLKTFLLGSALAYVIRIYVSLNQMNYCSSNNAKIYANNINIGMVIGIVTVVIDVFGYIHLFVEGTLLDIIEDTLHQKTKSQHSDDSDSDDQNDDDQKKQAKKYQKSQESFQDRKKLQSKSKKVVFKQNQIENPTNTNLLKSLKNKKDQKEQKQKQLDSKETDSFFIRLKTIGNRYLDNIEDQTDQNEEKQKGKIRKEIQSQETYKESDKKPKIQIPQSFEKLPKKYTPQMKRQSNDKEQTSLRESIDAFKMRKEDSEEKDSKQFEFNKNAYPNPKTSSYGKYGGFNRDKV